MISLLTRYLVNGIKMVKEQLTLQWTPIKKATFLWTHEHQNALIQLKEKLHSATVLGYLLVEWKYILDTNASIPTIGAVGTTSVGRGESYYLYKHPAHSTSEDILCNEMRVTSCCLLHPPVWTLTAWQEVISMHRSQPSYLVVPVQTSWGTACLLAGRTVSVQFWHWAQSLKISFKHRCNVKMWVWVIWVLWYV